MPWAASRSVAVWKGERAAKSLARWRTTAREASKQARRSWFAEVGDLATTADVVALVAGADLAVVLHERRPRLSRGLDVPALGLESSSWSAPRAASATTRSRRSRPPARDVVRLGAEVLRTSTAGVAAVAALLSRTPRWA